MKIGYYKEEREFEQELIVSLQLKLERPRSERFDESLESTVDYGEITQQVEKHLAHREIYLLETACDEIGYLILEHHPRVQYVDVKVEKTRLPVHITKSARITVEDRYERTNG